MVNLYSLFDNLDKKPAIEKKKKKRLRNPKFIGFTRVMRLDMILGMSPVLFNGGLILTIWAVFLSYNILSNLPVEVLLLHLNLFLV